MDRLAEGRPPFEERSFALVSVASLQCLRCGDAVPHRRALPSSLTRGSKEGYTRRRVDAARADDGTLIFGGGTSMDQIVGTAARLPEGDREELAIQALARSETVSDLAARHGVSRKFVYTQTHKPASR
jgi:hypothetical protein